MIIVTGGAGMIGSNIISMLNERGINDILVVDNLKDSEKFSNLVDLDITDYMDKENFITSVIADDNFGDIEAVFHEGACSDTTEQDGKYMMDNNYSYSKKLLHFCLRRNIPFLYASSAAIYGIRSSSFLEQHDQEQPINVYGYSKMLFDCYVRSVLSKTKSQICGLRYFNVYGPRESHKGNMASIIFQLNKQLNNGERPRLFEGSNKFKRDFIHVSDVVSVNLWFWKQGISGIFNCGTGHAESFQKIANFVLSYHKTGKTKQVEYIPIPDKLKKHYQTYTKANLSKLRSVGYNKLFRTASEGVIDYMDWLNRNE